MYFLRSVHRGMSRAQAFPDEAATYRREDLLLDREALLPPAAARPSAYYRPEIEPSLPKQALLLDRNRSVE